MGLTQPRICIHLTAWMSFVGYILLYFALYTHSLGEGGGLRSHVRRVFLEHGFK